MTFLISLSQRQLKALQVSRKKTAVKWQMEILTRQSRRGKRSRLARKSPRWASVKILPAERSESKIKQSAEQLDVQKTTCESGSIVARKTGSISMHATKKKKLHH
jgi:hypothetical protein